jgi:hypothetical protein
MFSFKVFWRLRSCHEQEQVYQTRSPYVSWLNTTVNCCLQDVLRITLAHKMCGTRTNDSQVVLNSTVIDSVESQLH